MLIARYGRSRADAGRQTLYTLSLAAATVLVILVSPWESPSDAPEEPLINLLIVFAIWRFAARLTASLSLEGSATEPTADRLYGVERVKLESWQSENTEQRPEKKNRTPANPSTAVARLAVVGLFVFALGEPFLLSGPPAVGERALVTMIVFLFATGIVLSSGSGIASLRRVRAAGGLFRRRAEVAELPADPFADLDALRRAEPRQAVLAAYGRLIAAFDRLEHERAERQTPYEFLASIPPRLRPLAEPARELTGVYVKAAYSEALVAETDRRQAIAALEALGRAQGVTLGSDPGTRS